MKFAKRLLLFTIVAPLTVWGQTKADQIVGEAEKAYQNSKGIRSAFTLEVKSDKSSQNGTTRGTIYLQGSNYYIDTPELKTWYNGSFLWTMIDGSSEVNLSKPSEKEMELYNPAVFFKIYRKAFVGAWKGSSKDQSGSYDVIELKPLRPHPQVSLIELRIHQKSKQILQIMLKNKNSINKISLQNYVTHQSFQDDFFSFPKKKYPKVDVIDLR